MWKRFARGDGEETGHAAFRHLLAFVGGPGFGLAAARIVPVEVLAVAVNCFDQVLYIVRDGDGPALDPGKSAGGGGKEVLGVHLAPLPWHRPAARDRVEHHKLRSARPGRAAAATG